VNQTISDKIFAVTTEWANERIFQARELLKRSGIHEAQQLPASIHYDSELSPQTIIFSFYAADYYIYVDQGVEGLGPNKKPTTGKFKFKTLSVSKGMAASIQDWIARKPILIRQDKKESSKSSVIPRAVSVSYAIAKTIKKTGIGKTLFWSNTFNEKSYKELGKRLEKSLGEAYRIEIKL